MRVFLDTNIVLDLLMARKLFVENAQIIFQLGLNGEYEMWVSDITMVTVAYYAKKNRSIAEMYAALNYLRSMLLISGAGQQAIDWALQLQNRDFEDAVQYYSAQNCGAEYIITRNKQDYPLNQITVLTPDEFLRSIGVK